MIYFLNGIIAEKQPNLAIIDVNGVGYAVGISSQTFAALPPTGANVFLYTYHHITETEQRLFGFLDRNEKALFELLITVKGVGPKLALSILSGMPASEIVGSISRQDAAMLARTPGIGKKTAERMVLELRDKVSVSGGTATAGGSSISTGSAAEAASALESLGFKRIDAENAISKVLKDNDATLETGEVVRKALQLLYK